MVIVIKNLLIALTINQTLYLFIIVCFSKIVGKKYRLQRTLFTSNSVELNMDAVTLNFDPPTLFFCWNNSF